MKYVFWNLVHACRWNEPLQISERVVFDEFDWKYYFSLNRKTDEWDLKFFLLITEMIWS